MEEKKIISVAVDEAARQERLYLVVFDGERKVRLIRWLNSDDKNCKKLDLESSFCLTGDDAQNFYDHLCSEYEVEIAEKV